MKEPKIIKLIPNEPLNNLRTRAREERRIAKEWQRNKDYLMKKWKFSKDAKEDTRLQINAAYKKKQVFINSIFVLFFACLLFAVVFFFNIFLLIIAVVASIFLLFYWWVLLLCYAPIQKPPVALDTAMIFCPQCAKITEWDFFESENRAYKQCKKCRSRVYHNEGYGDFTFISLPPSMSPKT